MAEKPSSACLASRVPVGTEVTPERLAVVEAAEEALHALGLNQVRVRHHGDLARVEVGAGEIELARQRTDELRAALLRNGFSRFELGIYESPAEKAHAAAPSGRR